MRLVLEKRTDRAALLAIASPLIAVALTVLATGIIFAVMGHDPLRALAIYFIVPVSDLWGLGELTVKATPLILIAVGLSLCYLSNNWNIGAEGQLVVGALFGTAVALVTHGTTQGPWLLPVMLLAGALGGALFGMIPAILKVRFGANEILTSLMLVYVAELALDFLVRGPWRDPHGFNMPQSVTLEPEATLAMLAGAGRANVGFLIAVAIVIIAAFVVGRTLRGFEIRLVGDAPRAAAFAGFSAGRVTLMVFAISGALAGLAGIMEIAGPMKQLQPQISPGYGFTAIIVAFLGRLNPVGCLVAGLVLALTFIGGDNAQMALRIPLDLTRVIQGMLLFFVLACDTLILYRLRLVRGAAAT